MTQFEKTVAPHFEQTRAEYLAEARHYARLIAKERPFVTVNDVRAVCPPPPHMDPRVMGAIFNRSDWERIGYIENPRKVCRGRPIARFVPRY